MRRENEDRIDPRKPALIVLYGATKRKCRPLTGDITVLGRNPGCDIGLVSPEVAPVHCVIVRLPGGWRIRDCSGRATRVNGKAIQDEPLHNGDVIQVGTFSFETHLPAVAFSPSAQGGTAAPVATAVEVDVEHLKASRRRLGERALILRRQLAEARANAADLARREQELHQLEARLRAQPARRAEPSTAPPEAASQLDRRQTELQHYSRALRRREQRLRELESQQTSQVETDRTSYEADLVKARAEVEKERREVAELRRSAEQRHMELEHTAAMLESELSREKEELENDREQVARERVYLDQQRQEVVRLRTELERQAEDRRAEDCRPVAAATTRDTQLDDDAPPDRLASARRLLRQLAERRKALTQTPQPALDVPKA